MKNKVFLILIITALILVTQLSAWAIGFETEKISPSEERRVENRISFSQYNTQKTPFSNFDINEKGMIALVAKSGTVNPTVYVYDGDGIFQYKYTVDTDGVIYAEWEGNDLWIYIVRGDHAVLVDNKGAVLKVEKILDTDTNTSYWYEVWEKKKTIGDEIYTAKTGLGVLGLVVNDYAQIVVTDAIGETKVLYDVSSMLLKKALLTTLLIAFLLFIGISVIVLVIKSASRHQNRICFGTPYKPNAKKTIYDRILDILENQKEVPRENDQDFH